MAKVKINDIEVTKQTEITAEMMIEYISDKFPNDKAWFKEQVMVEMPDMTFETLDEYENKINKNGKPSKRKKRKAVKVGTSKKFNITKARKVFCERYFPDLVKKNKQSITDIMKDW
jgi:hypothetical protein